MSNNTAVPVVAAGAGALAGSQVVAASGMTAVGMVGGGAGFGAPAGPVGIAVGALTGLAAYGVFRVFGDLGQEASYYGHLNYLRDIAPETGPAQFHCLHCRQALWPRATPGQWPGKTWVTEDEDRSCPNNWWHDAQPNVWNRA